MKKWILILAVCLLAGACSGNTTYEDLLPDIYPDYIGVTIPAGIAPMNFNLPEDYDRVFVRVKGGKGGELKVRGRWASFPVRAWHKLTEQFQTKSDTCVFAPFCRGQQRGIFHKIEIPVWLSRTVHRDNQVVLHGLCAQLFPKLNAVVIAHGFTRLPVDDIILLRLIDINHLVIHGLGM